MKSLRFDLTKPCADCPFRRDVPLHDGVAESMEGCLNTLNAGTFAHTCHKTDPRSDSPTGQASTGPLQHCAGAMLMILKTTGGIIDQTPMAVAANDGRLDLGKLKWSEHDEVYTGREFSEAYLKHMRGMVDRMNARVARKAARRG